MRVTVIIPAYNEQTTILELIQQVKDVPIEKEILVVDDGSKDKTAELLRSIKQTEQLKIFFHEKNKGKGSAIRTAIPHATGNVIIIQDADLELNPSCFSELIAPIEEGKTEIVFGSRFLKNPPKIRLLSKLANFAVTTTANILYDARITDEATCYKVFKANVLKSIPLKCKRFEFCPEIIAKVRKKGYEIYEVPVTFKPRTLAEGKKIGWKDGFQALWTLVKYRFVD